VSSAVLVTVSSGCTVCWSVVPLVFGCSSQETDLWDKGTFSNASKYSVVDTKAQNYLDKADVLCISVGVC